MAPAALGGTRRVSWDLGVVCCQSTTQSIQMSSVAQVAIHNKDRAPVKQVLLSRPTPDSTGASERVLLLSSADKNQYIYEVQHV
jgi:hypothetical protein